MTFFYGYLPTAILRRNLGEAQRPTFRRPLGRQFGGATEGNFNIGPHGVLRTGGEETPTHPPVPTTTPQSPQGG